MSNPERDFDLARKLGPLALLRLRSETLLQNYDEKLSNTEREELLRIASAPQLLDHEYLGQFDHFFEDED